MKYDSHWEPPEPVKLLITTHRLAEILNVPLWQAYNISYCLGRFYFGPRESRFRVSMASVHAYQELLEQGMNQSQACGVMYRNQTAPVVPARRPAQLTAQSRGFRRTRHWY